MDSLFILLLLSSNPSVEEFLLHCDVDTFYDSQMEKSKLAKYDPGVLVELASSQISYEEIDYDGTMLFTQSPSGERGAIIFSSRDTSLYDLLKVELASRAPTINLVTNRTNVFVPPDEKCIRYSFGIERVERNGIKFKNTASLYYDSSTGKRKLMLYVSWLR